jgi:hypothetical protein
MPHIVDLIAYESNRLNYLTKEYMKNNSKDNLINLKKSQENLTKMLERYGKLLQEEQEIFGDLSDIEKLDGKKRTRKSRSKRRRKSRSKKRSNKNL